MKKISKKFSRGEEPFGKDLFAALKRACEGLMYISETDAPVSAFLVLESAGNTRASVAKVLGIDLSYVRMFDAEKFLEQQALVRDWFGESEIQRAKKYLELHQLLEVSLKGLAGYRFGRTNIDIVIAGTDRRGNMAGVHTRAVET